MAFRDVIGHRRIVALLARSIARESLPPSLIFAGPSGVGKRLVAIAAAQALNCSAPSKRPEDACGTCSSCSRIARAVHPDVLVIEPGDSGTIKVDQVRDVVDRAGYRPFEGRRRVIIFDEADALIVTAQNALLKTLEEPPSSSVFILITSRPDVLLPTVRSRCPLLRFRPLDAAEVAAALVRLGQTEANARAAASVSEGSIVRAIDAVSGARASARDTAARVLTLAAKSEAPRARLEAAKELVEGMAAGDRGELASELRAMASLVRDVELLSAGADRGALANPDAESALTHLSAFAGDRGIRAFQAIDEALGALDRNAGVKVVADWLVLHL